MLKNIDIYFTYGNQAEKEETERALTDYAKRIGRRINGTYSDCRRDMPVMLYYVLQRIKKGYVSALLIKTEFDLGANEVIRRDNIITISHYNVKLYKLIRKDTICHYYRILSGIKRYNSIGSSWEREYGLIPRREGYAIQAGVCPIGYERVNSLKVKVSETTAPIVRCIYDLYLQGYQPKDITSEIMKNYGMELSRTSITSIISNPRYRGLSSGTFDSFPAIVTNRVWLRANGILHARSRSDKEHEYYLMYSLTLRRSRVKMRPERSYLSCSNVYAAERKGVRIEADASRIDDEVVRTVAEFIKANGNSLRSSVKSYQAEHAGKIMDEYRYYVEEAFDTGSAFSNLVFSDLDAESCCEELPDSSELDMLWVRFNQSLRYRHSAEMDLQLCCIPEADVDDYFDRMMQFASLGLPEKRYYVYTLVNNLTVSEFALHFIFIDGSERTAHFKNAILKKYAV